MPGGRPRKPTERHLLDGTYRKDRHGPVAAEDRPEPPPDRPDGLTDGVAAAWDRIVPLLAGVVKARDLGVIELCRWWDRAGRVAEVLDATEPTDPTFIRLMTAAGIATDKLLQLSQRFGLTPSDRAKLRAELPSGPAKPKVATRPPTKLDTQGPPT